MNSKFLSSLKLKSPSFLFDSSLPHFSSNLLSIHSRFFFSLNTNFLSRFRFPEKNPYDSSLDGSEIPCHWSESYPIRGGFGPPPPPRLLLSRVACMRGGEVIFREMNLSVHEGGAVMITGPNGSGKSTLLRMLAGFIKPSAGWFLWDGHDVTNYDIYDLYRTNVHLMGSKDAIKNDMTVDENVRYWSYIENTTERVKSSLKRVGLGNFLYEKASILSLGQRKRLQLARLLSMPRSIWLLDEPSVGLDLKGVRLLEEMIEEHKSYGGIVLVATHIPIQINNAESLQFPPRIQKFKASPF